MINEISGFVLGDNKTPNLNNVSPLNLLITESSMNGVKIINASISNIIIESVIYIPLVEKLLTVKDGDIINIKIQTIGGSVASCIFIQNAIDRCKGTVNIIVNGIAASCGGFLSAIPDNITVMPYAKIMFHSTSQFLQGKTLDILEQAGGIAKWCEKVLTDIKAKGLITEEEYRKIMDEKLDLYLTADEYKARLNASNKKGGEE